MSDTKIMSLLLLAVAFLGCADIPDELREEAKGDGTCGSSIYNPSTSFCYDGTVYAKCDGIKYNPTTQICQGISVSNAVCGGKKYNPLEDRCLDNAVQTKCGTGGYYYNASTQFCIGSSVYNKCNGKEYDPETKFCSDNAVYSKCGGSLYNPATQFCLSKDSKVYSLCGGKEYDPSKYECRSDVVQSECGTSWYSPETQFCYGDEIYSLCGGKWYRPDTKVCQNDVILVLCGTRGFNTETQFCWEDKVYSRCGGLTYNPATAQCQSGVVQYKCGATLYNPATQFCSDGILRDYDVFVDSRDDKTYKIVVIGSQTWMAENLNYNASGRRCYDNKESNCDKCGGLYSWNTAKKVCPSGWHLPSDEEWQELVDFAGGSNAGNKLKTTSGWNFSDGWLTSSPGNGTNDYGFSAMPCRNYSYSWSENDDSHWWSSSDYYRGGGIGRYVTYGDGVYYSYGSNEENWFYGVRCVKD